MSISKAQLQRTPTCTQVMEEAVLAEFEKIAERGGVLGAMETGCQRSKIQGR